MIMSRTLQYDEAHACIKYNDYNGPRGKRHCGQLFGCESVVQIKLRACVWQTHVKGDADDD